MPPPQTITMKMPEAAEVYLPSPSTARLKMPPHITEVHRPQRTSSMMLTGTCAMPNEMSLWKTGMLTTALTGQSMAQMTSRQAADATVESIALGETLAPSRPPAKRPMSIRNQ